MINNSKDFLLIADNPKSKVLMHLVSLQETIRAAKNSHALSNVATALFAESASATALLAANLKNKEDCLTITWNPTGVVERIFIESDYNGNLRGFISPSKIERAPEQNAFKTAPYINSGELSVKRHSFSGRAPYETITDLTTGEISQDIAHYISQSLQMQSFLELATRINDNGEIEIAGGILFLGLPGCSDEEIIEVYEQWVKKGNIAAVLLQGKEEVFQYLNELGYQVLEEKKQRFFCRCTENSIINTLQALEKEQLEEFIDEQNNVVVTCSFCSSEYKISQKRLRLDNE